MKQEIPRNSTEKPPENRIFMMVVGLLITVVMGMMYAFSIFIIPLESTFGWARHQTAMTFSLLLVFFALGMLTSGNFIARIGPAKTVSLGGLLSAAGFILASFTPNLPVLYLGYGIMGGYGIGLSYLVSTAAMLRWFPDKKGRATGLLTMGLAFGTFFLGTKLAGGLVSVYGWAVTFRVIAGVFFVVVACGGLLLKFPPPGYAPPNWTPPAGQAEIWGYKRANVVKTSTCWLFCLWALCIQMGGLMIIGHVVPYAVENGINQADAALAMGGYAIANGFGRLIFGWLNDKIGLKPTMLLDSALMGGALVSMVYLLKLAEYPGLFVAACLVGLAYGGAVPMLVMSTNTFFGPKFFPENYGFFCLPGGVIGGLLGPALGGYIQTMTGSYIAAFFFAAALAGVGLAVAAILKPPSRRTDDA